MKATIQKVSKESTDFQYPQMNVEVLYEDTRFPEGSRLFIFTLPYDQFSVLGEEELEQKIKLQGAYFDDLLQKAESLTQSETTLKLLEGKEIII